MTVYRYNTTSPIGEINTRKSAGGGARMYLHANNGLTPEHISLIKNLLIAQGWQCVPTQHNGRPSLEVRGCGRIEKLESVLRTDGFLLGAPAVSTNDDPKIGLKEWFTSNLLTIYGIMNVLGDIGYSIYDRILSKVDKEMNGPQAKKNWERTASTYAYLAGSASFLAFGRGDKTDYQVRGICRKLESKMRAEGLISTDNAYLSFTKPKHTALQKAYHALQSHPAEIGNALTGAAGGFIALGAHHEETKLDKWVETGLGLTTLGTGVGAALITEKKRDPSQPAPTGIKRITSWFQELPNRLSGYGYLVGTVVHGFQSIQKRMQVSKDSSLRPDLMKKVKLAYMLRFGFAAINFVGEFILTFASKGHGSGVKSDKSLDDTVYALVADVIIRQPESERERLITELGRNFIATPDILGGSPEAGEAGLRDRIRTLLKNPWSNLPAGTTLDIPGVSEETTRWRELHAPTKAQSSLSPSFA